MNFHNEKTLGICILVCLLIYIIKINTNTHEHFRHSIQYSRVVDAAASESGPALPPRYTNILLVLLDGATRQNLYSDAVSPVITARWNACGIRFSDAACVLPSVSAVNYFAILSGAPPYINGVVSNDFRHPWRQKTGSLFDSLNKAGLSSAVIGVHWYKEMFRGKTSYIPVECCGDRDSREVANAALDLITTKRLPYFTLLHFTAPDSVAHERQSGTGPHYTASIREIDALLGEIFAGLDKEYPSSLVIVTSDHGMNADGNHGGSEDATLKIPLYFFAHNLRHATVDGGYTCLSIAPTIAALSGIPMPDFSTGQLVTETLDEPRYNSYIGNSIARKELLARSLAHPSLIDAAPPFFSTADGRRMYETLLAQKLSNYPSALTARIMVTQRIIAALLIILFAGWAARRKAYGLKINLCANAAIVTGAGIVMRHIDSRIAYDIAAACLIFLMLCGAYCAFRFSSRSARRSPAPPGDAAGSLLYLTAETIILAGFFVPFYTIIPDPYIFSVRLFSLALFYPFILSALLRFFHVLDIKRARETVSR